MDIKFRMRVTAFVALLVSYQPTYAPKHPRRGVFGRIGRLVGDQERNKSSYSHTKFDIHPRERKQMLNKRQLILATGGTVAQDLTIQWSTMGGFMQSSLLMEI